LGRSTAARYETYREALRGRRLPLAFVDLDLLRANAAAMGTRSAGKPMRLATKSVRSVALLRLTLEEFPHFRGLMCFSAAEAAWLAGLGFDDLLVGYPTVEAEDLLAAARAAGGRRIAFVVDAARQVEALTEASAGVGAVLHAVIDVDMSTRFPGLHFGVRRSPLTAPGEVVALARAIVERPELRFDGILAYEAQIAGVQDALPGSALRSALVRMLKRFSRPAVAGRRAAVVAALREAGLAPQLVNGGGTGSLESTAADPSVTESTAGSGLFSPGLFDGYAGFRHLPAAGFALPVTRLPRPGIFTCHGGGYVASGSAGPDKLPRPYLPSGARLLGLEGAGEVQTPVSYAGPVRLGIGDPILLRHAKAGELCERFDHLTLLSEGRVVDEVPTYRGEGQCFL
jgi:D-serine deaminase-like pyridoxal phosphate-dependent protein